MPNLYSLLSSHPTHTRNSRHAGVCDRTILTERGMGGGGPRTPSKILDFYGALLQKTKLMGWLRLVGSLKLQVSSAEYRPFYRALLQNRPII